MSRLKTIATLPLLLLLVGAFLCGCESTSSTEVGVRTNLLGALEKRGYQQVYQPGGVYLVMNDSPIEGDRPVPDDITFKTKDGNNVHIDVNVMWRLDPRKAAFRVSNVGQTILEIKERVVRPVARSVIRDVFNEITSEEYYHVTAKNKTAAQAREQLTKELEPFGIIVDLLQVQQHRFDPEYQ